MSFQGIHFFLKKKNFQGKNSERKTNAVLVTLYFTLTDEVSVLNEVPYMLISQYICFFHLYYYLH